MTESLKRLTKEILEQAVLDTASKDRLPELPADGRELDRLWSFDSVEIQAWLSGMILAAQAMGPSLLINNAFLLGWRAREALLEVEDLKKLSVASGDEEVASG